MRPLRSMSAFPSVHRRRRGFSLMELLVVTAVVACLMALALPALQAARSEARRLSCANNLKQLAIAMHNYHDAHRNLPPAWCHPHGEPQKVALWGWSVRLLPFMEQISLYDQIDFDHPAPAPDARLTTAIPSYRCPSDYTGQTNPFRGGYGTLNYSLNFGDRPFPRWLPNHLSDTWPGSIATPLTPMQVSGISWQNSNCRFAMVTDGLSNTLMLGERSLTSGAGVWMGVTATDHEDDQLTDCSHWSRLNRSRSGFSSNHPDGANFAMGDGSVHFINNAIDSRPGNPALQPGQPDAEMGVYQRLANRHDHLPVGEF